MEESIDMVDDIFRNTNEKLTEEDIVMLNPLQLAYIGDAVFELLVRTYLLERDISVSDLHRAATRFVKARGQAEIFHLIEEALTDKERAIIKRGRNAKSHTSPKNADIIDYKYATGFEALMGYLYLKRENKRIREIFALIMNLKNKDYPI